MFFLASLYLKKKPVYLHWFKAVSDSLQLVGFCLQQDLGLINVRKKKQEKEPSKEQDKEKEQEKDQEEE